MFKKIDKTLITNWLDSVDYDRNPPIYKLKNNDLFKLTKILRSRLRSALRRKNAYKSNSTKELLGCDFKFLKNYIETKFTPDMSWDKMGSKIHIDHIKPCCSFDLTKEEEQRKCFHYSNLQPLWARDNLQKGGKF